MGDDPILLEPLEYIGRDEQKQVLRQQSQAIATNEKIVVLYVEANGGLGKTYLLRTYPRIVQEQAPDIRIADLVDFYDFQNRVPHIIELNIIKGLKKREGDVAQQDDQWYRLPSDKVDEAFKGYIQANEGYKRARERGSAGQGEYTEERLRELFIKDWNNLAEEYPLVLRFDTVEALYSLPAPEEALVSSAEVGTGAEQVFAWVGRVLPELKHTLALFSGRPEGHIFVEQLQMINLLNGGDILVLPPFTDSEDIVRYLAAYDVPVSEKELAQVIEKTEGHPLLLTCFAETRRRKSSIPPPFTVAGKASAREEFETEIVETILNPLAAQAHTRDPSEKILAYCLHFLSYARRGIRREDLRFLLEELAELEGMVDENEEIPLPLEELVEQIIANLHRVALVKVTQVTQFDEEFLLLHDEIHRLIDESGKSGELGLREPAIEHLAHTSKQQVQQKHGQDIAILLKAMSDHMYYEMAHDLVSGYRAYVVYVDWLLSEHVVGESLILSDIFWNTLNTWARRAGNVGLEDKPDIKAYLESLETIGGQLAYEQIIHDEQVDHIQGLIARGKYAEAAKRGSELYEQTVKEGILPPEDQEITSENLPKDQYLFVELSLWLACAIQFSHPSFGEQAQRAGRIFTRLIAFLENPDMVHDEFLSLRRHFFQGHAYNFRGYQYRQQQRYSAAIADYVKGRGAFRSYRDEPVAYGGKQVIPEKFLNDHITNDLAQVTNNLAYALSLTGNVKRALRLSHEVIEEFVPVSSDYQKALFYNTLAMIYLGIDDYQRAEGFVFLAAQAAEASGSTRARGFVSRTRGQVERARMMDCAEPDPGIEVHYSLADDLLQDEPDQRRETLYAWSGYARDLAVLYRTIGKTTEAATCEQQSVDLLDQAMKLLPEKTSTMQHADFLESKVVLLRIMGDYDQASGLLDQAEQIMREIQVPEYGQVVCGKIALQRGLLSLYREKAYQSTLRLMAIALARAYVFAREHHDQRRFESIITQHLAEIPTEELQKFKQDTKSERLYVESDDLEYQHPDPADWEESWEDSITFTNKFITERLKRQV
jgi:tetratricopeptide (TPR) repeat protein